MLGFDVNLAIDLAWGMAALDLLDPGQPDSCCYLDIRGHETLCKVLGSICFGTTQGFGLYVTKQFNDKMQFNHIFSFPCLLGRTRLF